MMMVNDDDDVNSFCTSFLFDGLDCFFFFFFFGEFG